MSRSSCLVELGTKEHHDSTGHGGFLDRLLQSVASEELRPSEGRSRRGVLRGPAGDKPTSLCNAQYADLSSRPGDASCEPAANRGSDEAIALRTRSRTLPLMVLYS